MYENPLFSKFMGDAGWSRQKDSKPAKNLPPHLLTAVQKVMEGKHYSCAFLEIDLDGVPTLTLSHGAAQPEIITLNDVVVNLTQLEPVQELRTDEL